MKIIYEPKGKALEYAPLACNLYKGCPHGCKYCYGPTLPNPAKKGLTMEEWRREWHSRSVPKPDALAKLESDCHTMNDRGSNLPVLLCFACDPYPPDEPHTARMQGPEPMTREALCVMNGLGITPIILTKGGTRACRDFDILKAAGGWFGQTCAWTSHLACKAWEPKAAPFIDRLDAAIAAEKAGVKEWWSVEPVIDPNEALCFIEDISDGVKQAHFKLGKLSGYDKETKAIEKSIDWPEYREQAREILNRAGYQEIFKPGVFEVGTFYVKSELREI